MVRCRYRRGFTLIEVLMAALVLILFPAGALMATLRLERFARFQVEEMAAAAFCEDLYHRCLREELFTEVSWKTLSGSGADWYVKLGASKNSAGTSIDNKIYLPAIREKGSSTFYTPLVRTGYKSPKYRISKKGDHDVRVSFRWGANLENYYQK